MADWQGGGSHQNEIFALMIAKAAAILAGLAGAFVANIFPPHKPWRERVVEYIGGALMAVYVGPTAGPVLHNAILAASAWWHVPSAHAIPQASIESLAGFMCGALGLTLIKGLLRWARQWSTQSSTRV
ncbi:hypothetical protein LB518_10070 [Mesorhizobium sp. BR1-1-16]|uniref:hypothetical protein n=1 Tax=Mesorhizobium sp. BR1-1-16 TaxID=2876653 RepID=UPI001CCBF4F9|nr:hypothetical protein [Mesorhizobium sp. BR1-1-16]MBZ9936641.1 hypothetical protein [Mesorhizobium sp. BR1-1-16]